MQNYQYQKTSGAFRAQTVRSGLVLLALLMLAGCASQAERQRSSTDPIIPAGPRAVAKDSSGPILLDEAGEEDEAAAFSGTETFAGTGVFLNRDAANRVPLPPDGEGAVTLNFEGQGIQEVIHAILGDILQENFVIAPGVSGEVTFSTARPLTRDQLLPILEMLLRWNGATLVWREDRFHVLPVAEAVRGNLTPRVAGAPLQRGYQVVAVPLQLNISMFPTSIVYLTNMVVVADMLVMVAEEAVVE
ncbi:MAG: hypothetical protein ACPGJE_06080, partial [Wenzhouxiangellaceae bacterium]